MTINTDPRSFLETVSGFMFARTATTSADRSIRIATVDANYAGDGAPKVTFDGETSVSSKLYAYVDSYRPKAGDRVVLVPVGTTYLIAGKVDDGTSTPVRSTNILTHEARASEGAVSTAGSSPRLTATAVDIPGATWTFATQHDGAVAAVDTVFDVESTNASVVVIGELVVDGVTNPQQAQALYQGTRRATVGQSYRIALAEAGSHTLKLTGRLLPAGDTEQIHPSHTGFTATVFDL